jgi:hypothetical protein
VSDAAQMFEDAIRWLRETYDDRPLFVERDVVYTVQLQRASTRRRRDVLGGLIHEYGWAA